MLTRLLYGQRQQDLIEDEIRLADTSKLASGLSETDLIQQLVSSLEPGLDINLALTVSLGSPVFAT